jgi:hypothetical protein
MNNLPPELQSLASTLEGIEMTNQTTQSIPTVRDLFAAAALAGIMAKVASPTMPSGTREAITKLSFQMADSMMTERDKGAQS